MTLSHEPKEVSDGKCTLSSPPSMMSSTTMPVSLRSTDAGLHMASRHVANTPTQKTLVVKPSEARIASNGTTKSKPSTANKKQPVRKNQGDPSSCTPLSQDAAAKFSFTPSLSLPSDRCHSSPQNRPQIPEPKSNPLVPFSFAPTSPFELESLIFPVPPPIAKEWREYEATRPDLRRKRMPILERQPIYAQGQREMLQRMTRPGQLHEDLADGTDDSWHGDGVRDTTEKEEQFDLGGKRFILGDITVRARDGFEIPVRWWERTTRDHSLGEDTVMKTARAGSASTSSSALLSSDKDEEVDRLSDKKHSTTSLIQMTYKSLGSSLSSSSSSRSSSCPLPSLPTTNPDNIVFYIHGGGLAVGEADSEELSCRRILLSSCRSILPNLRVYSVGYRLLPSHEASVCLSDTMAAFRYVRQQHPTSRMFLVGSSSGGELAAFVSQMASCCSSSLSGRESEVDGVVLRSPVTSDSHSGPEYLPHWLRRYHTTAQSIYETTLSRLMTRQIPRDGLERMPIESLTHELEHLPRHFVQLTTNDTLYGDGLCYARLLMEAGVEVKLQVEMGWPHTYWLVAPELNQSLEADWKMLRGLEWVASGRVGEKTA